MRYVLGISGLYHDSAAALLADGLIVAAVQEERLSRRKNDARFPERAIRSCLSQAGISAADLAAVAFYEKPLLKFTRTLEVFLGWAPRGGRAFARVLPEWLGGRLDLRARIRSALPGLPAGCPILFTTHHEAHAASAFLPSPFDEAAILTVDGVGEWATTAIARGTGGVIDPIEEIHFPHSLGLLYSAFTAYCGFRVNSGEYKLMGLAPYGEPRWVDTLLDEVLRLEADGSFRLNLEFFDPLAEDHLTNERFHERFGGPPRRPDEPIQPRHLDLARSIQAVTERAMLGLARRAHEQTGARRLCLAGGVALNCVANGRLLREGPFEELWIQPAAGDAGAALGAALAAWHGPAERGGLAGPRTPSPSDSMAGGFLGPEESPEAIEATLGRWNAVWERLAPETLRERVVQALMEGKVVGWVQGRMEFGPRALGHRSILGDPRNPDMQSRMNLKVKFRESFRPFAPAVLADRCGEFFGLEAQSPYMLLVAPVAESQRVPVDREAEGLDRLRQVRSTLPAVTHVDGSARVQTVDSGRNPGFHALLRRFEERTGCPVLINTSFNVRGEPVVATAADAYRCFINSRIDVLAVGPCLLERDRQPHASLPPGFEDVPD